jgi:hypothetical protein
VSILNEVALQALNDNVPEHSRGGIIRYIEQGIEPGGFLSAVICNDLKGAVGRADMRNQDALCRIVGWFFNYAPSVCWGSPQKFDEWIKQHALVREAESRDK